MPKRVEAPGARWLAGAVAACASAVAAVYDGKGTAWVRFADRRDRIVGGSRVSRG